MKQLMRMTLRKKIIIACLVCLIVPGSAVFILTGYSTKDVLIEQAVRDKSKSLELIDSNLTNLLRGMVYICNFIQFETEFTQILKSTLKDEDDITTKIMNQQIISNKFDTITYNRERTYITVLLPNGEYFTNYSAHEYDPTLFFQEQWFDDLKNMRAFDIMWIGTHPSYLKSDNHRNANLISIGRTLKYTSGMNDAYVIVSIYESELKNLFHYEAADEETLIVDNNGYIISHLDTDKIGKPLHYAGQLPSKGNYTKATIDGTEKLLFTHPLSAGPWKLVHSTDYNAVVGKVTHIYSTNLITQSLVFGLFILILVYLIRQFTRPIVKLDRIVSKVESGDLTIRSRIRGNDEIGKLGASFDHMIDRVVEMIERVKQEQMLKHKAELDMLQAQINPHFLFNILNSIRMKVFMNGDEQNAEIIASLSSLLRMTINRNNPMITLKEEIDTVRHYTALMNYRLKEQITLNLFTSSASPTALVPRFFLQPVIENAYIHGFQQRSGDVIIRCWLQEDGMIGVMVKDNGKGMDQRTLAELQDSIHHNYSTDYTKKPGSLSGIGLRNVCTRLKMIYGQRFNVHIESAPAVGTTIVFLFPLLSEEDLKHV